MSAVKECDQFRLQQSKTSNKDRFKWGELKVKFDNILHNHLDNIKKLPHKTIGAKVGIKFLTTVSEDYQEYTSVMMELSSLGAILELSKNISEVDKKNLFELLNRQSIALAKLQKSDMEGFSITCDFSWRLFLKDLNEDEKKFVITIFKGEFQPILDEYLNKRSKENKVLMKQHDWIIIGMYKALFEA